ncbi:hypothetical protein [Sphingobacterium multivorum]|uniref:hypothetical protein n=1 Tax=Sphingobacterium multivorum TaxID=28454 RepID=UPI0031BA799A
MSWDIVLFKSRQDIRDLSILDENKLEVTDFNQILDNSFREIKVDGDHREISGDDFSIDYFASEPNSNFMLSLNGEKAMQIMIELAKEHKWQIYDSALDAMIDLDNPLNNGYEKHQNYVEYILNKPEA